MYQVDRKHAQLSEISSSLVEAMNMYHSLLREPVVGAPMKGRFLLLGPPCTMVAIFRLKEGLASSWATLLWGTLLHLTWWLLQWVPCTPRCPGRQWITNTPPSRRLRVRAACTICSRYRPTPTHFLEEGRRRTQHLLISTNRRHLPISSTDVRSVRPPSSIEALNHLQYTALFTRNVVSMKSAFFLLISWSWHLYYSHQLANYQDNIDNMRKLFIRVTKQNRRKDAD